MPRGVPAHPRPDPQPERSAALRAGQRTYQLNPGCVCGCSKRYTSSGACVDCTRARSTMRYHKQTAAEREHQIARDRSRHQRNAQGRVQA